MSGYKSVVYKLTFPDDKVYIGVSCNVLSRWYGDGSHYDGQEVGEAIKQFGWENIRKEIIVKLPSNPENDKTCKAVEKELIRAYGINSYNVKGVEKVKVKRSYPKRYWTIDGEILPAAEWCRRYNVSYAGTLKRIERHGFTPKQALTLPRVPQEWRHSPKQFWSKWRGILNE